MFLLLFSLYFIVSEIHAYKIYFEVQTYDRKYNFSDKVVLDDSINNKIYFYLRQDDGEDNITNITFYLPGDVTFTGKNDTSLGDAADFGVNSSNQSIGQWNITDSTQLKNSFGSFWMEVNVPIDKEKEYTFQLNITYKNKSGILRNFTLWVDTLSPRDVKITKENDYEYYNISENLIVEVSSYDALWNKTILAVVFKNSTNYPYLPENTTYFIYENSHIENFTYEVPSKIIILKDIINGTTYNVLVKKIETSSNTYYIMLGNFTNTINNEWFNGGFVYDKENISQFLYIINFDKDLLINKSGIYYVNGTSLLLDSHQFDYLNVNLSYGFVNLSGLQIAYSNLSFNVSYVIENTTLVFKPLYDGNYSVFVEVWDLFSNTSSEISYEINNSPLVSPPTVSLDIVNGTRILVNKPFHFTFTLDDEAQNSSCSLYLNNSLEDSISNIGSGKYSLSSTPTQAKYYVVNITCINDFKLKGADFREIYVEDKPDLNLSLVSISPSAYGLNDEINISYNISNLGSSNANQVNITFKVCSDSSCTNILHEKYTEINTLSADEYKIDWFNYTIKDSSTLYIKMDAYSNDTDFDYSNQNLSLILSPTISISYAVSESTEDLKPGSDLTIYVNVVHYDGTYISELNENNFTIYDYWHYIGKYRNKTKNLYLINNFGNGTYKFAYTLPNISSNEKYYEFGAHKLILEVRTNKYKKINTTELNYDIQAPFVELYFSDVPSSMKEGDKKTAYIKAKNLGDMTINTIKITIKTSSTSKLTFNGDSSYSCNITGLTPGDTESCSFTLKAEDTGDVEIYVSSSSSDTYFILDKAYSKDYPGLGGKIYFYSYPEKDIEIEEEQESTTQESSSDETESSEETEENEETSQTSTTEESNKVSEIKIEIPENEYSFLINESKTIEIKIKNIGNKTASSLSLGLEYDKENLNITHDFKKSSLDPGKEYVFHLNVSSPTQRVGKYTIAITVVYDSNKVADGTLTITLLPTEKKKKEIEDMLENMKSEIEELDVPEDMKAVYDQTKRFIEEAENKIKNGDYVSAYALLEKAQKNINAIKMSATSKGKSKWWIWVIVILIILGIIGGVAYYLLTPPTSTYHPEKGYSFNPKVYEEQRANYIKRLKESLQRKLS